MQKIRGNKIIIGAVTINNSRSISIFQIILLIITSVGLKNHVFALPPLLQTAKRDSWLSVVLALVITLIWIMLLLAIHRKTNRENLFNWLFTHLNKWVVYIFSLMIIFGLILTGTATLRETVTWINISLLPETPRLVTAILLGLVSLSLAKINFKSICIINQFLLFFIIIFGFFVAIVNMQYKDYSLLLPVFEHGYTPILKGIAFPLSGFSELFLILTIQDKIKEPFRYRQFAITSFILAGLTIGPLIGAITEFSPGEAEKLRFPAYEEWELVSVGHFIEHIFFFVTYQWLTGTFIRLALILFFIKKLLSHSKKYGKPLFYLIFIIIEALTLYPISDMDYSQLLFYGSIPFIAVFFIGLSILLFFMVISASRKDRRASL